MVTGIGLMVSFVIVFAAGALFGFAVGGAMRDGEQ